MIRLRPSSLGGSAPSVLSPVSDVTHDVTNSRLCPLAPWLTRLHAAEEHVSFSLMFVQMKTDLRRRLLKADIQVVSTGSLSEDACGGMKRLKVRRTFHLKY